MAERCTNPDRKYSYDNIKFVLIFLVVFAHLLEVNGYFEEKKTLYNLIYSFHMPMFVFLSGYFARFSRKKIAFSFLYTYILMQILYSAFDYFVLTQEPSEPFSVHFTTPYWLLWYLLALVFFYLLIPFFQQRDRRKQVAVMIVLFTVSLLFGFDRTIGYYFSLARFFSFLPYFVMGMYIRERSHEIEGFIRSKSGKALFLSLLISAGLILSELLLCRNTQIQASMMYGSKAYSDEFGLVEKLQITLVALLWIAFILMVFQRFVNYRIPIVSSIGKNTLPIFLLHGFAVKMVGKTGLLNVNGEGDLKKTLLFTVVLVLLLGNPAVNFCFTWIFTGEWLKRLWGRFDKRANTNKG